MKFLMQHEQGSEIFHKYRTFLEERPSSLSDIEEEGFYRFIINYLTSLDLTEEEARQHYYKIIQHKDVMSKSLNRDVGFRVAALDYFHNIEHELNNPKIIEIDMFEKILNQSKIDPKTGCYHLKFFKEIVHMEISRAVRYNHSLSIVMLDIDDFKKINTVFGHEHADHLLQIFSKEVKASLREEDILGRYGGDEFIILLPHTGRIGARVMAERIREFLSEAFNSQDETPITFSGGIATFPYDGKTCNKLIENADHALYRSKFLGKNRIYDYLEENAGKESGEKRKERRHYLKPPLPIKIRNSESELLKISGKAINISSSGILIECLCEVNEEILAHNLSLRIERFLKKNNSPFQIAGEVVRINKNARNYKFHIALKFDQSFDTNILQGMEKPENEALSFFEQSKTFL